jgi:hypothetical protein
MKITTLSVLTALALSATSASALTLYTDPATGQVYTQAGEGRIEMGDFVDAKTVYEENQAQDSAAMKKELNEKSGSKITIMRNDSPEFLLGQETDINMKFVPEDNKDMWFKAGVRIQGTFEDVNSNQAGSYQDAYLRRTRFEAAAGFGKHSSFVMDIRNDKANYEQKGEQSFNVGDAYVQIKKPFDTSLLNFKLYRAKIDISRTETVKSARVIAYDRPKVADYAAQFISHNRRATNAQAYGDWNKKVHYQVAFGDATYEGALDDAKGTAVDEANNDKGKINKQSFFYGGKIVLSPFDGWEETQRTETYMGEGKHFEIGAGYWAVNSIQVDNGAGVQDNLNNELINLEMSAHYKGFFVQAEYFKMKDVVEDFEAPLALNTGNSTGWYATSEYVIPELAYLAPFIRYEKWDKFDDVDGYDYEAKIAGVNWYLRGNTTKVGLYVQKETFGDKISDNETSEEDVTTVRLTSQWFF